MLETVAPEANYVKTSGQIFLNHDIQVGGISGCHLVPNLDEISWGEGSPGGLGRSWIEKVMPISTKMPTSCQNSTCYLVLPASSATRAGQKS